MDLWSKVWVSRKSAARDQLAQVFRDKSFIIVWDNFELVRGVPRQVCLRCFQRATRNS